MWYFSWILGAGLACCFAILNALWYELKDGNNLSIDHLKESSDSDAHDHSKVTFSEPTI